MKIHLMRFPETHGQYKARIKDLKDLIFFYETAVGKSYKELDPAAKNAVYVAMRCKRTGEDLDTI